MAPGPNVENLRKQAKGLLKQLRTEGAGDAGESVRRVRRALPRLSQVADADIGSAGVTLQEAQHVIAVEQGFSHWKQMLAEAGESSRPAWGTLYVRPGLPNVRREAEWFLSMIRRGEGWPMDRIRQCLRRVANLSNDEILQANVTLAEVQQGVAGDYGFPDWATLESELGRLQPVKIFEDFAELEDHELKQVIFRLGRDRLAIALKVASDRLKDRFKSNMAPAAWQALVDAMEALGPMPLSAVEVEQGRILQKFRSDDPVV